jgi:hypothetical protein
MIMMQDLYEFNRTDIRPDGSIVGDYRPTGIRSSYARRLEIAGYKTDSRLIRTGED